MFSNTCRDQKKSHPSHPYMISLTQMLSAMRTSLGHVSFLDSKDLMSTRIQRNNHFQGLT